MIKTLMIPVKSTNRVRRVVNLKLTKEVTKGHKTLRRNNPNIGPISAPAMEIAALNIKIVSTCFNKNEFS